MARTSKTKIGGGSGEQSERMMRAAEGGEQAVQRAHEGLVRTQQVGAQQTMQGAGMAADIVGAGEQRMQQREQFDRSISLDAAKHGLEEQEPGSRAAQVEAEMAKGEQQPKLGPLGPNEQQNLADQGEEKLEMDSNGRWRPTKEAKAAGERKARREDFEADTERLRVMNDKQRIADSAQRALAEGDEETYEAFAKQRASYPNSRQDQFDRMMNDDPNDTDWADLEKRAKEISAIDPTALADVKAKNWSPRVKEMSRALIGKESLDAILDSKGNTSALKIDWTNPKMQEFEDQRKYIAMQFASIPGLADMFKIKSTADKMRIINVLAAAEVKGGISRAPRGRGAGGMTPATAPQGQAPAPGGEVAPTGPSPETEIFNQQRGQATHAVRGVRRAGGTPGEAIEAGQQIQPTRERTEPSFRERVLGGF